jgi:hypothetical protein
MGLIGITLYPKEGRNVNSELVNPVRAALDRHKLSTYQARDILGISQPAVWRHAAGKRMIQEDCLEAYSSKLKIPIKHLRDWNRHLRRIRREHSTDHAPRGDLRPDPS